MRRIACAAALAVLLSAALASSAQADHLRRCQRIKGLHAVLRAGVNTSCPFAKATWAVLIVKAVNTGTAYRGTIHVHSPVTHRTYPLICTFYPRGTIVYDCSGDPSPTGAAGPWVRVTDPYNQDGSPR